ncbi:MAG: ligase-associated DNA damage response exonuclease [Marivibrio sp.]|uniref:ligase-associated DNA damage response exonuclease n=1 Tax=Marivibrio sp. TaxID=2039719 RepID=UPI0032EDCF7B
MTTDADPERWLQVTDGGLYCAPGDFYVDPHRGAERAVITHGHADHARWGNSHVLATEGTLAIMAARYGADAWKTKQTLAYGETVRIGPVAVSFAPAGHVLGSAQAVLEYKGARVVVSGDYKRRADPTCPSFEPVACDVFITEATFGLPVFRHPPDSEEIGKLLRSLETFPERTHLLGAYALGKAQRLLRLLRQAGYDRTIYLHGAMTALCELYEAHGVALGPLEPVSRRDKKSLAGEIVLCPPSALADKWSRSFKDPLSVMASGWMRVRQRARQRNVELPLILSDHADWDELIQTLADVGAPRVWVTHGREEALVHYARREGYDADALSLVGREDEEDD